MVARHFLCCLPLRLGALLISLVQLVLFGLIAAGSFYTITTSMRTSQRSPLSPKTDAFFFSASDRWSSATVFEMGRHCQGILLHRAHHRRLHRVSLCLSPPEQWLRLLRSLSLGGAMTQFFY